MRRGMLRAVDRVAAGWTRQGRQVSPMGGLVAVRECEVGFTQAHAAGSRRNASVPRLGRNGEDCGLGVTWRPGSLHAGSRGPLGGTSDWVGVGSGVLAQRAPRFSLVASWPRPQRTA